MLVKLSNIDLRLAKLNFNIWLTCKWKTYSIFLIRNRLSTSKNILEKSEKMTQFWVSSRFGNRAGKRYFWCMNCETWQASMTTCPYKFNCSKQIVHRATSSSIVNSMFVKLLNIHTKNSENIKNSILTSRVCQLPI
jgi:hypothetical protein